MNKVIMFTSQDCVPCKQIKNTLASKGFDLNKIELIYVDTDDGSQKASKYAVHGVPTTLFIKEDMIMDSFCGNSPTLAKQIIEWL